MQATRRDLKDHRVAVDRGEALGWLARRLVWEARVRDLEAPRGAPTTLAGWSGPRTVRDHGHTDRERTPVARAS
jgi:hypothetical protein